MGKVLWHVTMSLDGFIAGPRRCYGLDGPVRGSEPTVDEAIKTTGAVLAGRRSYDVGRMKGQRAEARKIYSGAWTGPVFVLTHQALDGPEDPTITFISGNIRRAVSIALGAAGGRNVLVIGANVAQQCINEGLIDEILVHLAPLLLGDGVRLFGRQGVPVDLETTSVTQSGQLTNLRFRVVK